MPVVEHSAHRCPSDTKRTPQRPKARVVVWRSSSLDLDYNDTTMGRFGRFGREFPESNETHPLEIDSMTF